MLVVLEVERWVEVGLAVFEVELLVVVPEYFVSK